MVMPMLLRIPEFLAYLSEFQLLCSSGGYTDADGVTIGDDNISALPSPVSVSPTTKPGAHDRYVAATSNSDSAEVDCRLALYDTMCIPSIPVWFFLKLLVLPHVACLWGMAFTVLLFHPTMILLLSALQRLFGRLTLTTCL
jgi:hypothetical protein